MEAPLDQPDYVSKTYVHGYALRETERLQDQAGALADLLHSDTQYPEGAKVLEAGCGVGAQTPTLVRFSPGAHFTCIDVSAENLAEAERRAIDAGLEDVEFRRADIFDLPFEDGTFDHALVCFVLEHLSDANKALRCISRVVKSGGTVTVIEGDHGSAYFHPDSEAAHAAIDCQIALQQRAGGNALIGRQLYPIMSAALLESIRVSPRIVYADASRPHLVDGFIKNTFIAMIEGVRGPGIVAGLITQEAFDEGIRDLGRTAETGGVFCYSFFKGVGTVTS